LFGIGVAKEKGVSVAGAYLLVVYTVLYSVIYMTCAKYAHR